jgi:hypothetical protein
VRSLRIFSSVVATVLSSTLVAHAFVNGTGRCLGSSDGYWSPGTKLMRFLDGERNGPIRPFPPINSELPDAEKNYFSAQLAADWGINAWRWTSGGFDTGGSTWIETNQNNNVGDIPRWFDTGNEKSELWWDTNPIVCSTPLDLIPVPGKPAVGAYACTQYDHKDCFTWGKNEILAADIDINAAQRWDVVQQNSMLRCFTRTSGSMENTVMHEIGHAYGLSHSDDAASVMSASKPRIRNCTFFNGYHDAIMPDDLQGYLQYHKSYSGTRINLSGTPWWVNSPYGDLTSSTIMFADLNSASQSVTLRYTLHSYYRHATGRYRVRYFLGEDVLPPTFNPSTGRYTFPASLSQADATEVSSVSSHYSTRQSVSLQIMPSDLPRAGVWYHVWVQIDSMYEVAETDETDNAFPTAVIVRRIR